MATADSVKAKLQGLIDAANATTGNADADLTTAVNALVAGFGQSGGSSEMETQWIAAIERVEANPVTGIPAGVTIIGDCAFYKCTILALTSLPAGVTRIGSNAFYNCSGLTELTFEGTPTSISSSAFNGCINLLTINVPWSEGSVSGAPWRATNATINYNYTGG